MKKVISQNKTISRLVVEIITAIGLFSVITGFLQKIFHLGSIYDPIILGLTPRDFFALGGIAFLLAIAISCRRILKHLEGIAQKK